MKCIAWEADSRIIKVNGMDRVQLKYGWFKQVGMAGTARKSGGGKVHAAACMKSPHVQVFHWRDRLAGQISWGSLAEARALSKLNDFSTSFWSTNPGAMSPYPPSSFTLPLHSFCLAVIFFSLVLANHTSASFYPHPWPLTLDGWIKIKIMRDI